MGIQKSIGNLEPKHNVELFGILSQACMFVVIPVRRIVSD